MLDAYIYHGLRTPFGRHGGTLAAVRPDDLAAGIIRSVLSTSAFPADRIEDVILGCTNQAGEDCRNVARHAALLAGLPEAVAGQTVNRLCGSGLAAVLDAARAISCGEGNLYVAGGVESMTRAPLVLSKAETAFGREQKLHDSTIGARFANKALVAQFGNDSMPETADNIAREFDLGRTASDAFARESQRRYAAAKADGFYAGELQPVAVPDHKRGETREVDEDEHPRPDATPESLGKLKPLFAGGVVTAGNASGINDGAAALLIGSRDIGREAGAQPIARIVCGAVAGVSPRLMGLGPVPAARKALERAGLTLGDIDLIEINEAFAVQVLGCLKGLELSADDSRVNPNGGAIAIGHPLGASGARLALTAARQLQRSGGRYGLVSLCIGVGQGIALVIERVPR